MSRHKIDLGPDKVFEIEVKGKTYELGEPNASQIKRMDIASKNKDEDSITPLINMLYELGLPKEVAATMPISKIEKLIDGIVGAIQEKKSPALPTKRQG